MPTTKLGDWGTGGQTSLGAVDQDDPACDCADLPDDVECWICVHRRVRQ